MGKSVGRKLPSSPTKKLENCKNCKIVGNVIEIIAQNSGIVPKIKNSDKVIKT